MLHIISFISLCITNGLASSMVESIVFDEITTESPGDGNNYEIGWVKVFGCTEGRGTPFEFPHNNNPNYMKQIAPYAISLKIVPSKEHEYAPQIFNNYAVFTKPCSNPMVSVNRLREASFNVNPSTVRITGYQNINNWYGTTVARERLINSCTSGVGSSPRSFTDIFYHACGNVEGFHIVADGAVCEWEYEETFGTNIDVYFGFDASKSMMCDGKGNGGLTVIPPDNIVWTKLFDCYEGRDEDINGIHLNPEYEKSELRNLLKYAISMKILPRGNSPGIDEESNFAVTAQMCNPSVIAINNGKEASFSLKSDLTISGYQDINTWSGSIVARNRLKNGCREGEPGDIFDVFYHACGNVDGMHIVPSLNVCEWDYENILNRDIQVWIAYDLNQEKCCSAVGTIGDCK